MELEKRYKTERDILELLLQALEMLRVGEGMTQRGQIEVCCGNEESIEPWAKTIRSLFYHTALHLTLARDMFKTIADESQLRVGPMPINAFFSDLEYHLRHSRNRFDIILERGKQVCED